MAEIDQLRGRRGPLRSSFTKTANNLDSNCKVEILNIDNISAALAQIEEKWLRISEIDKEIIVLMEKDSDKFTESDFLDEFEKSEEYSDRLIFLRTKCLRILKEFETSKSKTNSNISEEFTRKFKLPKIELKKFDGDVKQWLNFWGQFKKIHEDKDLAPEDKYQYLIQATVPGSKPRDLIESFPPSGENYFKAIEYLKDRFGREDILVEVYVRELLGLVMKNATSPSNKTAIYKLYDKIETHLRALETLSVTKDKYASMLYPLVEACLPEETLRIWERNLSSSVEHGQTNKLESLMKFLKREVEGEERILMVRQGFGIEVKDKKYIQSKTAYSNRSNYSTAAGLLSNVSNTPKPFKNECCIFCENSHASHDCKEAENTSLDEKKNLVMKLGCCFICLKPGHMANRCRKFVKCKKCSRKHYYLMCPNKSGVQKEQKESVQEKEKGLTLANKTFMETVLMQTLTVKMHGENNKVKFVRALIDTGSHMSYVTKELAQEMGYETLGRKTIKHCLFGGVESEQFHQKFRIVISNLEENYKCNFEVFDQPKICSEVLEIPQGTWIGELKQHGITLCDSPIKRIAKGATSEIQILIGSDIAGKLLTGNLRQLDCGLTAVETRLGWTLMGKVLQNVSPENLSASVLSLFIQESSISKLWDLEAIGIKDSAEAKAKEVVNTETMEFFHRTVKVNQEGRYEVSLPWKEGHSHLGDNKVQAEKRLLATTNRLLKLGYLEEYERIFKDWQNCGIIELAPENGVKGHYLPHQAVVKNSSLTTKIRPVFDASAKDEKGNSLNACLETGPNMVELIPKLLIQYRKNAIGVISDVKQAFLQISLSTSDRDYLKFLWWKDSTRKEIITLRHRRVVFGVSPSPFLLGATIACHLDKSPEDLKETAMHLKRSFYVDNCVTSLESREEVEKFIHESKKLMSSAQFELRGWVTAPLKVVGTDTEQEILPVLGMTWDTKRDELFCNVNSVTLAANTVTKRTLLSVAQRIFDPVGFTCPTTLIPKLILQRTWKMKCGWDEALPQEISKDFHAWLENIQLLNECRIPRRLTLGPYQDCEISLHVFCDASMSSYAACVFLRASCEGGNKTSVRLVLSKSRVAPSKPITIPRLELLAALIGTRMYCYVREALNVSHCRTYFWSDSMVALSWIKREGNWNIFVRNRVHEIRQCTDPKDWYHIPGSMNPADLASRGCNAKALLESRWWEGPKWLIEEPTAWPIHEFIETDDAKEAMNVERKNIVISNVVCKVVDTTKALTYFSKYTKIIRMVAWMLRFVYNCRHKEDTRKGELSYEEVQSAEKRVLLCIQNESFKGKDVKVIKDIHTFKDNDGLLRIRTKLVLGDEPEDFKCPILLPGDNVIVYRLIYQKHCQTQHAGLGTLLVNLRETYWIVGVRRLSRKITSQCVICKRFKVKEVEPPFAPLPRDRIKCAAVFEVTGIDLAGPLYLLSGEKVWIVLFTCAIYRAVHFELTKHLSTESFIMALRRFIARRGRTSIIYTDNGSNFVGTNNALKNLDWEKIISVSTVQKIKWNFNPPTAAWWGGWWERLVRMLKELLRRVLGKTTVNYVELETILCDCEATINSRPLTYVNDDAESLKPLTPACFMQDIPHNDTTDLDAVDHSSLNRRLRYLQKLRKDLRQRFRNEYLALLVHRGRRKGGALHVGDIVLVCTDAKRINWPLGLIVEIFPGKDGHARVAKVKTAEGVKTRPFQRLFPMEISRTADLLTGPTDETPLKLPDIPSKLPDIPSKLPDIPLKVPDIPLKLPDIQSESDSTSCVKSRDTTKLTFSRAGRPIKVPKRLDL